MKYIGRSFHPSYFIVLWNLWKSTAANLVVSGAIPPYLFYFPSPVWNCSRDAINLEYLLSKGV
jgi:hypothetical protein